MESANCVSSPPSTAISPGKERTLDVRKYIRTILLEEVEFRTLLIYSLELKKKLWVAALAHTYTCNCAVVSHDALHSQFSQNHITKD